MASGSPFPQTLTALLRREPALNTLSPALTETAKMRLEHPDFSYEQLGVALGISKSGVKNRLKRLKQIYDKK